MTMTSAKSYSVVAQGLVQVGALQPRAHTQIANEHQTNQTPMCGATITHLRSAMTISYAKTLGRPQRPRPGLMLKNPESARLVNLTIENPVIP